MDKIDSIVESISKKLTDYDFVKNIIKDNKIIIDVVEINYFNELSLSHGIPSLCMLYGELNEIYPNQGWDQIGNNYISIIGNKLMNEGINSLSIFSGLSGIGLATVCLSHNGLHYNNFINNINKYIKSNAYNYLKSLKFKNDLHMEYYDIISGVSGLGNYCTLFKEDEEMVNILTEIVKYIINLTEDISVNDKKVPGWYIKSNNQFSQKDKEKWPQGCFNIGLAHGIPSLLILLINASKIGINLNGQNNSIYKLIQFLINFRVEDNNGGYWTTHISLKEFNNNEINDFYTRDAWCYGTPGVAYSLLLAGIQLNNDEYVNIAVNAMKNSIKNLRDVKSSIFCHGLSGIAYITYKFFLKTQDKFFKEQYIQLIDKILDMYNPNTPFGFFDIEANYEKDIIHNNIGIIDGTTGVILTLLALKYGNKTPWDYAFMLN